MDNFHFVVFAITQNAISQESIALSPWGFHQIIALVQGWKTPGEGPGLDIQLLLQAECPLIYGPKRSIFGGFRTSPDSILARGLI